MSNFKKYPSLFNSKKNINRLLMDFTSDDLGKVIAIEKIDGANFQINASKEGIYFCSRNQVVGKWENGDIKNRNNAFFNFPAAIDKLDTEFMDTLEELAQDHNIILYGELYGNTVQKRINYREKTPTLSFFDIVFDGYFMAPADILRDVVINRSDCAAHYFCYRFGKHFIYYNDRFFKKNNMTLLEALEFNFPKTYDYRSVEGIIIRPFDKTFFNKKGDIICVKKVIEAFSEIKTKQIKEGSNPQIGIYQLEFKELLNQNRVSSYISKVGKITDIGKAITDIMEDAKKDFRDLDHCENIDENEYKKIFKKQSGHVYHLIEPFLEDK